MMSYYELISPSLWRHIPELLGWLVGLVLAVVMVRRSDGKTETLFLAGCGLMFIVQLISPLLSGLVSTLVHQGWRTPQTVGLIFQLPMGILGLAGFVCLVYAFWTKFKAMNFETLEPRDKEAAPQY